MAEVTQILRPIGVGRVEASAGLLPLVDDELRWLRYGDGLQRVANALHLAAELGLAAAPLRSWKCHSGQCHSGQTLFSVSFSSVTMPKWDIGWEHCVLFRRDRNV